MFNTPREILKAYKDGLVGSWCDPEDTDKLLGELPHPLFGVAASDLYSSGKGKVALLHKSAIKHDQVLDLTNDKLQVASRTQHAMLWT